MKQYFANKKWFLLMLLFLATAAQTAELTARIDRNKIASDETFTLTVRYSGNAQGEPDFSLLEKKFDILGKQQSTSFSTVNGRFSGYTEWSLSLAPMEEGRQIIPSFKLDGLISDAIEIEVLPPQQQPTGKLKDGFVETIVDKTTSYEQEQITVSYRLYYAINIDRRSGDDLEIDDVIIVDLEDTTYQREVDGKLYRVTEFNYALFPQTSGNLEIPALNWTLNVANYRIGRIEKRRVRTETKTLTVKPQPAAFPLNATWLPSANITLNENWTKEPSNFKIGEPITRSLTLEAEGLMASQLPVIATENDTDDVKFYPDQPSKTDEKSNSTVMSRRIETAAVVVSSAGEVTIPGIRIPWWDLKTDSLRYAEVPSRTIQIAGQVPVPNNIDTSAHISALTNPLAGESALQPQHSGNPIPPPTGIWRILAIVFALLWLSFVWMWWQARRQSSYNRRPVKENDAQVSEKQAFNELTSACRKQSPQSVRCALLKWAQMRWPQAHILTLNDIANQIGDKQTQQCILQLDTALYGINTSDWSGERLLAGLSHNADRATQKKEENVGGLQPLYP